MEYNELKALYEATTNPAQKQIYGNHLRRMEGKLTGCGPCMVDEPELVEEEAIEEPIVAQDEGEV